MKNLKTIIILLFFTSTISGQTTKSGNFSFEFRKAYENGLFETYSSGHYIKFDRNSMKKVQVRFRVKSTSSKRELFDPNLLYMVIDKHKKRIRTIDIKYNYIATSFPSFEMINESNKHKKSYRNYKDTFDDYKIDGYEDIKLKLIFSRKEGPQTYFYKPKKLRVNLVDAYFLLPKQANEADIYFKGKKLVSIKI